MTDETDWLRRYARDRSHEAFRALVDRYVNVVHAAARRQVGDADLARDVTQAVFLILAEKAPELARAENPRPLIGWLLQVTRYASANAVRARARRARHERRAAEMSSTQMTTNDASGSDEWQQLAPLLDEGINRLRANDRDVLLLRFFEQKTAREVGLSLGISEDAAEKRIARAVAKLRDFFQRRGVAVSAVALATTLAAHCAEAAPVGLNAAIAASAASAAGTAVAAASSPAAAAGVGSAASATSSSAASLSAGAIAKGTLITMASAKTKTALAAAVAALLLAGSGTVAVKTFVSSPRPRQVTVAAAPASAAANADGGVSANAAAGPLVAPAVRFSQGTTVELVAISDAPEEPSRWWAPDGTPVPPPAERPRARFGKVDGQRSYQVVLRWTDPAGVAARPAGPWAGPGGGLNLLVYLDGAQVQGTANTSQTFGGNIVECYQFTMTNDPSTVNVRLSLGAGEWSPEQRYSLEGVGSGAAGTATAPTSTPAAIAPPARELILEGVTETADGWLDVAFRWAPQATRHRTPLAEKLVLIGRDGVEVIPQRFRGLPGGRSVLGFRALREDVAELLYQHRPYEEREIRNVSLKPGRKTAPAAGEVQYRARRRS